MAAKVLKGKEACELLIEDFKTAAHRWGITLEEYLRRWEEREPEHMHAFMSFLAAWGYEIPLPRHDSDPPQIEI